MKKIDYENMDDKTLSKEVNKSKKELFDLRLNLVAGQVKDYSQFKKLRKDVARALTVLRRKESKQASING